MLRLTTKVNLRCVRKVFKKYLALNNELALEWINEKDVPWWYNERASLSVLAGAVWKCKGYAFEEYSIKKKGENSKVSGRIDMEFGFGNCEFVVEAKQIWLRCNKIIDYREKLEKVMLEAEIDVWRCYTNGRRRLAVVFCAPYTMKKTIEENKMRMNMIEEQSASLDFDIHGRITPSLGFMPTDELGHQYTTGFVWVKEVKKSPNKSWEATRSLVRGS